MKIFKTKLTITFFFFCLFLFGASSVQAATLSLEPDETSVDSGKDLVVKIELDAKADELIDGADAVLEFDALKLKPKQVKAGSAFKNVVTKEAKGRLQVTGLASPNGVSFSKKTEIAQVSFQILESGKTSVNFSFSANTTTDSNVAAHGSAKDILTDAVGGTYQVTATPAQQTISFFRRLLPFLLILIVLLLIGGGLYYWYKKRGSAGGGEREEVFVPHEAPLDRPPPEETASDVVGVPSVQSNSQTTVVGGEGS